MVKNNIEVDVKVKCIENGTTQAQIAEGIQTTKSYVNRMIKKPNGVVNNTFVQMMEIWNFVFDKNTSGCIFRLYNSE